MWGKGDFERGMWGAVVKGDVGDDVTRGDVGEGMLERSEMWWRVMRGKGVRGGVWGGDVVRRGRCGEEGEMWKRGNVVWVDVG